MSHDPNNSAGVQPASERVTLIRAGQGTPGTLQTPGMVREEAVSTSGMWAGQVRTAPHMVSGWHHHAEYETTIYVVAGRARLEFGPGGQDAVEAGPGDFLYVPKGLVHRELNPADEESLLVVVRSGSGIPVVNVDRPRADERG